MPAEKFPRAHPSFAFDLKVAQEHRAGASADEQPALVAAQHFAGRTADSALLDAGEDLELPRSLRRRQGRVRGGPRIHRADAPVDRGVRRGPVDRAVFAGKFCGMRCLGFTLRHSRRMTRSEQRQRLRERVGGDEGEPVVQRAAGFATANRRFADEQDVAGVEPLGHGHHGDSADAIARFDRRLDRCGAAIFWKNGRVQIQAREPRRIEHRLRQNLAVSHDHDHVCVQRNDLRDRFRRAQFHRLQHRHSALHRELLDRRRMQLLLAAHRLVRLRHRRDHFMRGEQPAKRGQADLARAHEEDAHWRDVIGDQ